MQPAAQPGGVSMRAQNAANPPVIPPHLQQPRRLIHDLQQIHSYTGRYYQEDAAKQRLADLFVASAISSAVQPIPGLGTRLTVSGNNHKPFTITGDVISADSTELDLATIKAMMLVTVGPVDPNDPNPPHVYIYKAPQSEKMRNLLLQAAEEIGFQIHFSGKKAEKAMWAPVLTAHQQKVGTAYHAINAQIAHQQQVIADRHAQVDTPAATSAIADNSFFHALTHQLLHQDKYIPLFNADPAIWQLFQQTLQDTHGLVVQTPDHLKRFIDACPHPLDRELVLGPVLRRCVESLAGRAIHGEINPQQAFLFAHRFDAKLTIKTKLAAPLSQADLHALHAQFPPADFEIMQTTHNDEHVLSITSKQAGRWALDMVLDTALPHWSFNYPTPDEDRAHNATCVLDAEGRAQQPAPGCPYPAPLFASYIAQQAAAAPPPPPQPHHAPMMAAAGGVPQRPEPAAPSFQMPDFVREAVVGMFRLPDISSPMAGPQFLNPQNVLAADGQPAVEHQRRLMRV